MPGAAGISGQAQPSNYTPQANPGVAAALAAQAAQQQALFSTQLNQQASALFNQDKAANIAATPGTPYDNSFMSANDPNAAGSAAASGIAGQLGAQIAALQAQEQAGSKQMGSLYGGLASQLQQFVPQEDKAYQGTIANVGNINNQLQQSIGSNYDQTANQINTEMARLGQQQTAPNVDASLLGNKDFAQSLAALQGAGQKTDLNFLQAGAHNYNQDVVGMAKTEGANKQANLVQALQAEIAAAATANSKAQASAAKAAISAASKLGIGKTGVEGLLAQMAASGGGNAKWATAGGEALQSFLNSAQGQSGKQQIGKETYKTVKDPNNPGQYILQGVGGLAPTLVNSTSASIGAQMQAYLAALMPGTANAATVQNLGELLGQTYAGNKNYAGT